MLSVLSLNFIFIDPRYRLTISDSENVVALGVFLIAAFLVGRLVATARERAGGRGAGEAGGGARADAAILADARLSGAGGRLPRYPVRLLITEPGIGYRLREQA